MIETKETAGRRRRSIEQQIGLVVMEMEIVKALINTSCSSWSQSSIAPISRLFNSLRAGRVQIHRTPIFSFRDFPF